MMFSDPRDAQEWLIKESSDKRFHMQLLKLGWQRDPELEQQYLSALLKLADKLAEHPDTVHDLIAHDAWVIQLIGNTIAIIQDDSQFEQTIINRMFKRHSWVAPQLAAGFALIQSGQHIIQFEDYLIKAEQDFNKGLNVHPKTTLSIYTALKLLDNQIANDFIKKPAFTALQAKDIDASIGWVAVNYKYWRKLDSRYWDNLRALTK